MAKKIQIRRDTANNWLNTNTVLAQWEQGFETDTGKLKIWDWQTDWNDLSYFWYRKANLDWGNSFTGNQIIDWYVWISWPWGLWVGNPGAVWWVINIWEAGVWGYRSAYISQDQSWYIIINNQQNSYIELQTNNGTNKIRFDENWNVWIWTTTPWDKLDVNWQYWRITYNTSSNMW